MFARLYELENDVQILVYKSHNEEKEGVKDVNFLFNLSELMKQDEEIGGELVDEFKSYPIHISISSDSGELSDEEWEEEVDDLLGEDNPHEILSLIKTILSKGEIE